MQFVRAYGAYICIMLLVVVTASIWFRVLSAPRPGELVVAALNVGQGDALYIKSPTGVEVLIDGGPGSSLLRELPKIMSYGDREIDAVLATHPDEDHIGGLVDLVMRYEIKNFIEPGIPKSTATAQALQNNVNEKNIPRSIASRGVWLDLGGGVRLDILYPDTDVSNLPDSKSNEGCVVARLTYKNATALFMCDASFAIEGHLLATASSSELDVDLLKVGHHGSKYSSGSEFLDIVDADVAVISVGRNSYGHPTEEAIGRIENSGAKIYRTDLHGAVIFSSFGENFKIK